MADQGDLDIDGEGRTGSSSQQVRKNINIKLKSSPKAKSRGRKPTSGAGRGRKRTVDEDEPQEPPIDSDEEVVVPSMKPLPGEPVHQDKRLNWNHKVQLIGEKVLDPAIHCCEKCNMPILIYGRMIPCKHVFCFDCAKKTEKNCPRCNDAVIRIEQSALGTVFVCRYGGSKHGVNGCRRTYLSQRDLQAHIDHRHLKTKPASSSHSRSSSHASSHSSQSHLSSGQHSHQTHTSSVIPGQHQQPVASHQSSAAQSHDPMLYQHQRSAESSQQMHHAPPQQGQAHHQAVPQQNLAPPQQNMSLSQGHSLPQQDPYHSNLDQQQQMPPRAASNLISVPIQDEANRQGPSQNQSAYTQGQGYSTHPTGSYSQSQAPPQQHYPPASQAHHPQPHSSGPYTSAQYNPTPQQGGIPPLNTQPPMRQPHHGAPPRAGGTQRYPSPHNRGPYEDQYSGGGHSPRTWGPSSQGPRAQSRSAQQTRPPTSTSGMGPPPSRQQYY